MKIVQITHSKSGKIGTHYTKGPTDYFTVWRTKEQQEEYKDMYLNYNNYCLSNTSTKEKTEKDILKEVFPNQLKKVLNKIYSKWNPYWVCSQSYIQRSSMTRILQGEILPNIITFVRLLVFINNHLDNFNIYFLFSPKAEMFKEDNFKAREIEDVLQYFEY